MQRGAGCQSHNTTLTACDKCIMENFEEDPYWANWLQQEVFENILTVPFATVKSKSGLITILAQKALSVDSDEKCRRLKNFLTASQKRKASAQHKRRQGWCIRKLEQNGIEMFGLQCLGSHLPFYPVKAVLSLFCLTSIARLSFYCRLLERSGEPWNPVVYNLSLSCPLTVLKSVENKTNWSNGSQIFCNVCLCQESW